MRDVSAQEFAPFVEVGWSIHAGMKRSGVYWCRAVHASSDQRLFAQSEISLGDCAFVLLKLLKATA